MSAGTEELALRLGAASFVAVVREDDVLGFEVLAIAAGTAAGENHVRGELERLAMGRKSSRCRLVRLRVEGIMAE